MKKIFSLFAAVLLAGGMMAQAPVGTTLFSENFSSFAKDAVPSGQVTTATGRVVYGDAKVTYTTVNGGSTSKIYEENVAGGTSPEILISKNNGSLTIAGIPSGGAKEITVSYKQNKQKLKVESTTTGYTGSKEEKPADVGANSFDITVADGSAATFDLVFTCTGSSNVRVDDIAVTVKTAGEGGGGTPVEPKEEFYLTGSFRSWAATADANFKFAATATEGEYSLEAEFDAEITCKAIGLKEGADVKWYPDGMGNDLALEAGEYTIYLRPAGNAGEGWHEGVLKAEKKAAPVLPDPTNCAEAREAALSVSANNEEYNGGKVYTIEGYVTDIAFAWADGSMSFWMADTEDGGKVLEAYKCAIAKEEDAVRVGDKVAVTGKLTKYNTTPEFATGCTVEIKERAEVVDPDNLGEKTIAEFLQLKNTKDTCVLTGKVIEIVNDQYGNLTIEDATGSLYVYGVLTPAGESKKFSTLDVAVNDVLTIKATYTEYNDNPQVKNAIFVSREKATPSAIDNATVNSKEQKMIIDGQLFIIRDGVMFNANGAAVK